MESIQCAKYVSFASAGTRGIVYLGVLDALEAELNTFSDGYEVWRSSLKGVAGTSAGACAALMLLLGLDGKARRDVIMEMSDMRRVMRCPDVSLLVNRFGLEEGKGFRETIQRVLLKGGLSGDSTFADLKRLIRQDFVCMCTNLHTGDPMELSTTSTPHVKVCDAIYASCCVPFVFTPIEIDNSMVMDGCLSKDLPTPFVEAETLFVQIDNVAEAPTVSSWVDFLAGIVRASVRAQSLTWSKLIERQPELCILIEPINGIDRMPTFDINLNEQSTESLFKAGYACTLHHLRGKKIFTALGSLVCLVHKIKLTEIVEQMPNDECQSEGSQCNKSNS